MIKDFANHAAKMLDACSRNEGEEVVIDSFVPKPGQVKTTTFSQQQRMKVMKGAEKLEQQDDAMWSTLIGKSNMMNPLKKCLLAVIVLPPFHRSDRTHDNVR